MIKLHFPLGSAQGTATGPGALTNEETNALRYAAGYVPRALKKALSKSAHPLKKDLQLCLLDLLDDGDPLHPKNLCESPHSEYSLGVSAETEAADNLSSSGPHTHHWI